MARGFCPNHECPNTDVLDTERPCPTCGREVGELTPKEYWRTRTIKLMHSHEIAEIAEIQEVARRALGEASLVPKAQESEDEAARQDQESALDVSSAEVTELLRESEEIMGGGVEAEQVGTVWEIEEVMDVEEHMVDAAGVTSERGLTEPEMEAPGSAEAGEAEMTHEGERGLEELSETPDRESMEPDAAEQKGSDASEEETNPSELLQVEGSSESVSELEEPERAMAMVESERHTGIETLEGVSEVEEVPFVEGLLGAGIDADLMEDESTRMEPMGEEESDTSRQVGEADGVEDIADVREGESPDDAADAELSEWKRSEQVHRESSEEIASPIELPVGGGVERPASPVRIITFREGGMEIGICPYCGRFVRGSDLSRHKLKHRVRKAFGLQGED